MKIEKIKQFEHIALKDFLILKMIVSLKAQKIAGGVLFFKGQRLSSITER